MDFEVINQFLALHFTLIGVIIFACIYQCIIKYWSFFKTKNVKFIRGPPFLGAHYKMILGRKTLAESFRDNYNQFPNEKFFGIYELGGVPVYMIRDPDLIQQISIKDFNYFVNHRVQIDIESDPFFGRSMFIANDQFWRDIRTTVSPAFTGVKMRMMFDLVSKVVQKRCTNIKEQMVGTEQIYDLKDLMTRIIADTIASAAFGINVNSLKDRNNDFFTIGSKMVNFDGFQLFKFLAYGQMPKFMNFLRIKLLKKSHENYFRDLVIGIIEQRKRENIIRPDMINLVMEAQESSKREWNSDDLVAQPLAFFFGGFNTITVVVNFVLYELALNPDIEKKLYQEIFDTAKILNGEPLTFEVLSKLKYIEMIVAETLRRWPPASANDRRVNKPYVLENSDGTKVKLNVGDSLWMLTDPISMDPKYFPDPETFDPERFNAENKANMPQNVYMPFGIGPRSCVASRFALMECKAIIYYFVSNFIIDRTSPEMQNPVKLKRGTPLLEPENGFKVKLRLR